MYFVSGVLSATVRLTHSKKQARHNGRFRPETSQKLSIGATGKCPAQPERGSESVEDALAQAKEDLEHARKQADLLHRDQRLKAQPRSFESRGTVQKRQAIRPCWDRHAV